MRGALLEPRRALICFSDSASLRSLITARSDSCTDGDVEGLDEDVEDEADEDTMMAPLREWMYRQE